MVVLDTTASSTTERTPAAASEASRLDMEAMNSNGVHDEAVKLKDDGDELSRLSSQREDECKDMGDRTRQPVSDIPIIP